MQKEEVEKRKSSSIEYARPGPYSPAIIYVTKKIDAEQIAKALQIGGVRADFYHAGLKIDNRNYVHESFMSDELQVVVATSAFGMGIDRAEIRRVIHWGCVQTLESYVQQTGRAGRDGLESEAILFSDPKDISSIKRRILMDESKSDKRKEHLLSLFNKMVEFTETKKCRRNVIIEYFNERAIEEKTDDGVCKKLEDGTIICSKCDNCLQEIVEEEREEVSKFAQLFFQVVKQIDGKFGLTSIMDVLSAKESPTAKKNQLKTRYSQVWGISSRLHPRSVVWWKDLSTSLLKLGYLDQKVHNGTFGAWSTIILSNKGEKWLRNEQKESIYVAMPKIKRINVTSINSTSNVVLRAPEQEKISSANAMDRYLETRLLRVLVDRRNKFLIKHRTLGANVFQQPEDLIGIGALKQIAAKRCSSANRIRESVEGVHGGVPQIFLEDLAQSLIDYCKQQNVFTFNLDIETCIEPNKQTTVTKAPKTNESVIQLIVNKKATSLAELSKQVGMAENETLESIILSISEAQNPQASLNEIWAFFGLNENNEKAIRISISKNGVKSLVKIADECGVSFSQVRMVVCRMVTEGRKIDSSGNLVEHIQPTTKQQMMHLPKQGPSTPVKVKLAPKCDEDEDLLALLDSGAKRTPEGADRHDDEEILRLLDEMDESMDL
eukprot:GHVL01041852.1.p1 GENE.GHVL01041852.1~~GHVL01041852.1.p1  ORF type:complete len:664 (+),score=111.10 GHVL01041852.1:887-2878(+)